jgi:phospholipid/cholesterol/gamma-HCH transport system substrate-binding protein
MRFKFNRFEKIAGMFVLTSLFIAFLAALAVGIQNAWFSKRSYFTAEFEKASGIFPGTQVEMSGLQAGRVESVDLGKDNKIVVRFSLLHKFALRLHEDSVVSTKRPFIIGEKLLEVSVGSPDKPRLREGSQLMARASLDLLDAMDPKKLEPYMDTF